MSYRNFEALIERARGGKRRGVVAAAEDRHILEAVLEARGRGIAEFALVGDTARILEKLSDLGAEPGDFRIVEAPGGENPAQRAVSLIASGEGDFLIKGRMDTKDLLKPVVDRANNLHDPNSASGGLMSHLAFFEIPGFDRLVVLTDGGMVMYPTLEQKKGLILNAVHTLREMGWERPRVAVLCAVEKVNPKMKETVEAEALMQMNRSGDIEGCVVEGPISYDIAMSPEIAAIKGYESENCGRFDVLLTPDMTSGNLLGKSLLISAGARLAGLVVGARVPIVVTSRGSSAEEKFYSIVLCAAR
ncbi:MAG: phosphate butyryltransferase [Fretibacterium sp.]|nr:phosphate butyryltransferase [Fretibacterium sp.]